MIGSFAAVRSDTFRIRSYGEVLDPVTQVPTGRAWREAIVQRISNPVQPSDPDTQNAAYWQPEDEDFLVRKFKIINFVGSMKMRCDLMLMFSKIVKR